MKKPLIEAIMELCEERGYVVQSVDFTVEGKIEVLIAETPLP